MNTKLQKLKSDLNIAKEVHKRTDTWEDFEKVVLIELRILILEKELKNES